MYRFDCISNACNSSYDWSIGTACKYMVKDTGVGPLFTRVAAQLTMISVTAQEVLVLCQLIQHYILG